MKTLAQVAKVRTAPAHRGFVDAWVMGRSPGSRGAGAGPCRQASPSHAMGTVVKTLRSLTVAGAAPDWRGLEV